MSWMAGTSPAMTVGPVLPGHHHVENSGVALLGGGKRIPDRLWQIGKLLHPLPCEVEMASQLGIIRAFNRYSVIEILAGRRAIRIMMHVTFAHCFIFFVVENDDDDRQLMPLGGAERLNDRVVKERAVADEQHHRPFGGGELYSECRP